MLCLAAISCTNIEGAASPVSPGVGRGGGLADGAHGDGGQRGGTRLELCGIVVMCHDGVLSGMYGSFCNPIAGVCPLGCRGPSAETSDLSLDPSQFAQTLCVSPVGDAGDASVEDGRAVGGDAAAGEGI